MPFLLPNQHLELPHGRISTAAPYRPCHHTIAGANHCIIHLHAGLKGEVVESVVMVYGTTPAHTTVVLVLVLLWPA